jgi:hypothetical protein
VQSFPHSLSDSSIVETDIPARLDRLPWGRFHTRVVVALGITWILDGLEVTLAGALSGALKESPVLEFTNADVGIASSAYLAGAVLGAVFFGWLTDRLGRKRLFFITLAVYLVATAATAFSWDLASFMLFRFLTGAGIGGEYTAINSTIQELVPARYRGWTDLVINGSFWVGAAIGAGASIVLLDPALFSPDIGWRVAFFMGSVLGLVIFIMRFWIPESPRWLVIHGRPAEAQLIIAGIEERFRRRGVRLGEESLPRIRLATRRFTPLGEVARCNRPPSNDHHDLRALRAAPRGRRLAVRDRGFIGDWSDRGLDRDFLLRIRGGKLGLFDGERNFPTRNPRASYRILLCNWHWCRRRGWPLVVRCPNRYRLALEPVCGVPAGLAPMLAAALVAFRWAVAAERKPLESVAKPLASIE